MIMGRWSLEIEGFVMENEIEQLKTNDKVYKGLPIFISDACSSVGGGHGRAKSGIIGS
jgi:hypothetical protein